MNLISALFSRLQRRHLALEDTQLQRLKALPPPPALDALLHQQRFVVLDLETTGLNLSRDIVISIGAVTIEDGAIDMAQQFECTLRRQVKVNEAVLIHGIAPSELAAGQPPAEALLSFMEFAADSVMPAPKLLYAAKLPASVVDATAIAPRQLAGESLATSVDSLPAAITMARVTPCAYAASITSG